MKRAAYLLSVKSGGWSHHPDAHHADYRLLHFQVVVSRDGKPLGGNKVQVVLGAPDRTRYRLEEDAAMWLPSGWWVSLRNQLAMAPDVAAEILTSVRERLAEVTGQLSQARGQQAEELTAELFGTEFRAEGPDYWR